MTPYNLTYVPQDGAWHDIAGDAADATKVNWQILGNGNAWISFDDTAPAFTTLPDPDSGPYTAVNLLAQGQVVLNVLGNTHAWVLALGGPVWVSSISDD